MKYLLSIVASLATLIVSITSVQSLSAQSLPSVAIGAIQDGASLNIVTEPTSTIVVDLSLSTTSFTAGIYARYAQKYLGERAQLTDKTLSIVESCNLSLAPQDFLYAEKYNTPIEEESVKNPAQDLSIDRSSAEIMIPEQTAQNIANQIFANRRICHDLIAGDVGEGVFGEGLKTALDRFDKMEREYLALFMGKEQTTTTTRRFTVQLKPDVTRYMIGRYDAQRGLLPANQINGEPIYLQITPSNVADSTYIAPGSKGAARRVFIVPNPSQCDLYVGADVMSSVVFPLYTYGSRATLLYDPK